MKTSDTIRNSCSASGFDSFHQWSLRIKHIKEQNINMCSNSSYNLSIVFMQVRAVVGVDTMMTSKELSGKEDCGSLRICWGIQKDQKEEFENRQFTAWKKRHPVNDVKTTANVCRPGCLMSTRLICCLSAIKVIVQRLIKTGLHIDKRNFPYMELNYRFILNLWNTCVGAVFLSTQTHF